MDSAMAGTEGTVTVEFGVGGYTLEATTSLNEGASNGEVGGFHLVLSGKPNPNPGSNNTISDLIGNDFVTSLLSIDTAFSIYADVKPASPEGIYHLIDPTVLEEGDYVSKMGIDGSALFNLFNNEIMV